MKKEKEKKCNFQQKYIQDLISLSKKQNPALAKMQNVKYKKYPKSLLGIVNDLPFLTQREPLMQFTICNRMRFSLSSFMTLLFIALLQ